MLKAINLSKNYNGNTALDRLDLNIEAGEVYCLLGANGAGKTTTINLFLNFIEPDDGKALINTLDVTEQPLETKKFLAYIPEQVNLYKNLSGLEKLSVADFDQVPRFTFQEESFANVFSRVIFRVLFLLAASKVLMYLAFGKLANYRLEK